MYQKSKYKNQGEQSENTGYTFRDLSKEWLFLKSPQLKISSVAKYSNILNLYLLPRFGDNLVSSISRSDIISMSRELLISGGKTATGLAPKTVNSVSYLW